MSGILGVIQRDGRPVEPALLDAMMATISHRGPDGGDVWIGDRLGVGAQMMHVTPESIRETQPFIDHLGRVVVFDGRLDDRRDLIEAIGHRGVPISPEAPDVAVVGAAFEAFGDGCLERMVGDFSLGIVDPVDGSVLIARDSIGLRPLHYFLTRDLFVFATEIKAVLAHPGVRTSPNETLIAQWLLQGWPQEAPGATFFENIWSVEPGCMLKVESHRAQRRRYWDFDMGRTVRLDGFPEYAEAFSQVLGEAVKRRMRTIDTVTVSLSGGLDSSSIACQAARWRDQDQSLPKVVAISYSDIDGGPADERAFIDAATDHANFPVRFISATSGGIVGIGEQVIRAGETPFGTAMVDVMLATLETTRTEGSRVLVTGHWGDQMVANYAYLVDLAKHLRFDKVSRDLREMPRWAVDEDPAAFKKTFLGDLVRSFVPDRLRPTVRNVRARWKPPAFDAPWYGSGLRELARRPTTLKVPSVGRFHSRNARAIFLEARSPYAQLSMDWDNKVAAQAGVEMWFPFLDRDVIAFLMAIPGEMAMWKGQHRAILREGMRGVIPDVIADRRWKGDLTAAWNRSIEVDLPLIEPMLRAPGGAVDRGFLVEQRLVELLNVDGLASESRKSRLAEVAGLDEWTRQFFPS